MFAQLFAVLPLLAAVMAVPTSHGEAEPAAPAYEAAPAEGNAYEAGWEQDGGYEAGGYEAGWGGEGEVVHQTTITSTAAGSYYTPQHGSGSEGTITDLNSCLEVCKAKFGGGGIAPPAETGKPEEVPPPTETQPEAGGAVHTIIVAPTQGVLRFVPFAVNAKPGDKLHYIWGANMHTTTLSDGDNVCNKSTTANAFDSGTLNLTATFDQVVDFDISKPTFFYCKVGMHCASGMFGLINPPMSNVSNELTDQATKTTAPAEKSTAGSGGGSTCVGDSIDCWVERYAGGGKRQKQIHDGVKEKCASVPEAWAWGGKWDMSKYETTVITKEIIIENVMYSRYMLATNPSMLDKTAPFPSNWTAPAELNSFVTTGDESAAESASYGAAPAASGSGDAAAAGESGAAGEGTTEAAAAAGANTGGADQMRVPLITLAAVGLGLGMFI